MPSARPARARNVSVRVGHISGSSREYDVPADTTVAQLMEKLKIELQEGEEVLNDNAETVQLTETVRAGQEYIVASNLKARSY